MSGVATTLTSVLAVFGVALVVRLLVRNRDQVAYASVLAAVGLGTAALNVDPGLELTSDIIFLLLLPAVIFQGTTSLDVHELRHDAPLVLVLTLVGLPLAITVFGLAGTIAFGFELPVALLFAVIILPTDPAAVLSMFEEFDVEERLAVTIEGESLFNDGIAIVVFSTLLASIQTAGESVTDLATVAGLAGFLGDIAVVGGGGLLLGGVVGYLAHRLVRGLADSMTVLLVTVVVAYGSFLVAEHFLGLSGVLATVGAGISMGAHEDAHDGMSDPEHTVQEVWETLAFLVTTVLYVLIGASVELSAFVDHAGLVALAAVLVLLVRALTIYPLVAATNQLLDEPFPARCQHIMVWAGLHTVVPVALVLAVPDGVASGQPLKTMVFGVAIASLVVQGLLMPEALDLTGLAGGGDPAED